MLYRKSLLILLFLLVGLFSCLIIYFSITPKEPKKNYLLTAEKRNSNPQALIGSNKFLLYTKYCGSGCEGLQIINTATGKTYDGVLSYMADDNTGYDYFVFQDWQNKYHNFVGTLENISGSIENNTITLIFNANLPNQREFKKYDIQIKIN